ncbi:MAG: UvrD-helicase domain-containing protein, partial [Colwellia sp.]|nr:UvrD-helicase domain-containing protein [Colwellia sp.]
MPVRITSEQGTIVTTDPKSNIRVIAVPGSGKSTVLVHRIGYLMKSGIKAEHILGIMFNDSAVENFKNDLEQLEFMALPDVKTYHAYARKMGFILEKRGIVPKTNFTPNAFSYKNFYREALNQFIPVHLHKMLEVKSNKTVASFIRFVELCKSSLKDPKEVFEKFDFPITHISFIDAFYASEKKRKEKNIQFFSDLIYDLILTSKEKPESINFISNK